MKRVDTIRPRSRAVRLHVRGLGLPDETAIQLWIVDGRISTEPVAGADTVFDGGWILPGLVDAHCHVGLGKHGNVELDEAIAQAETERDVGALLLRDCGSPTDTRGLDDHEDLPRIIRAGRHLARPKRYIAGFAVELEDESQLDGRADQYALALTAIHLFAGAPPVDRSHTGPLQPPKLSAFRPDLARLDGVLSRALATAPADRFGSCREFADAMNEQAGVAIADQSSGGVDASEVTAAAGEEAYVVDYPAYGWPEAVDCKEPSARAPAPAAPTPQRRGSMLQSAAGVLARRLDNFSTATKAPASPTRRRPRRILVGAVAVLLLAGLFAVGIVIGRKTNTTATEVARPPTSGSAVPSAPTTTVAVTAPVPLDGTYRIEIQRSKQTYDYTPTPQPPDVNTWWAFRTSCTPTECLAAATMLDDNDHTQAKTPPVRPFLMQFGEGQWKSRPETVQFPCVGPNGSPSTQATTQLLALRPQPQGDLVGEMVVTVHSNECGQQGAVIRIPAVASRSGDLPPAVTVPDPATIPDTPDTTSTATLTPPTTTAPGPGR